MLESSWMLMAFGAMFGWGLGQGFTKKYINDVSGTKFCMYFVVAVSVVNMILWIQGGAPNPFYTADVVLANGDIQPGVFEGGFVFYATMAYILDGIAWAAYFICIKYAPITIVGTVAAGYPAIVMVVLYLWIGQDPTNIMWAGGILVVLGCVMLGYTPKSALDENIDNSHVVPKIWIPLAVIAAVAWGLCFSFVPYLSSPDATVAEIAAAAAAGEILPPRFEGALGADIYPLMALGDMIIMIPFALIVGGKTDKHSISGIKLAAIPMIFFALGNVCIPLANAADKASEHGGLIAAISAAYPMVTLGFAAVFLRERIIKFHWCAVAVVISGIMICTGSVETVWKIITGDKVEVQVQEEVQEEARVQEIQLQYIQVAKEVQLQVEYK